MCSLSADDDFAAPAAAESALYSPLSAAGTDDAAVVLCQKCRRLPAVLLLRANDIYCRSCFAAAFGHKVRSTIGKSRRLQPANRVMVAVTGTAASASFLHVLTTSSAIRYDPLLLFLNYAARRAAVSTDGDLTSSSSRFPSYVCLSAWPVLQLTAAAQQDEQQEAEDVEEAVDRLLSSASPSLLASSSRSTSRQCLRRLLRLHLLVRCARRLNCRHLMLPDCTETSLAVDAVADLATGRGLQLATRLAFADQRFADVEVLRPMRQVSAKEVALFAHHERLEYIALPISESLSTVGAGGIHSVSKGFILSLQAGFPSTVSTVFRTGNKLKSADVGVWCCHLCRLPREARLARGDEASSARQATQFSRWVSTRGPAELAQDPLRKKHAFSTEDPGSAAEDPEWDGLCYSCEVIARDVGAQTLRPILEWVGEE